MNHDVFIAIGSNIGDRAAYLEKAIAKLSELDGIQVTQCSSIYDTEPIGYVEQQSFLNMVIRIQTSLSPSELLKKTQSIERECGRTRDVRWGPRTIDLDILLYDKENVKKEDLLIPHPRMWERAFVIVPLMELDKTIRTESGQTILEIYDELPDKEGVKFWKPNK